VERSFCRSRAGHRIAIRCCRIPRRARRSYVVVKDETKGDWGMFKSGREGLEGARIANRLDCRLVEHIFSRTRFEYNPFRISIRLDLKSNDRLACLALQSGFGHRGIPFLPDISDHDVEVRPEVHSVGWRQNLDGALR